MSTTAPTTPTPTPGTRKARTATSASSASSASSEATDERPTKAEAAPRARSRAAGRPTPSAGTVWKVLAVLGVVGTIGFGLAWAGASSRATTEDGLSPAVVDMRDAGREFAIALTNFDAATIDADFDRIVDYATGDFAEEAERFYDEEIRTQLRDAQATSRSEIRDIYVQSFDGDSGSVFFTADQTVANNLSPRPITDTLRVELGMVEVDGEWKVRTVEVLQAPPGTQLQASGLDEEEADPAPSTTEPEG